tara:strand:- start:916 stop:1380 length:465 start_codon:yes stop_codon:yes gene_type:complete
MPIPSKKVGEKQSQYMIRCVPQMMKYHDKQQAIAICYRAFQGKMINLETYNDYPQSASNNAKKVLRWRDKHGDEVKGMTRVGWVRANQLANKENISRETIARMSAFQRHKKNAEVDAKFKSTPWKDKGYVAWLGWGGTSGINWASKKLKQIDKK